MRVEIRRNEDGVIMEGHFDSAFNKFWWEQGNASCDCNRELFFMEFAEEDEEDFEEYCSEGRFSVRIKSDTGEVLYNELGD